MAGGLLQRLLVAAGLSILMWACFAAVTWRGAVG